VPETGDDHPIALS